MKRKKEYFVIEKLILIILFLGTFAMFFWGIMDQPMVLPFTLLSFYLINKKKRDITIKAHGNKGENLACKKLSQLNGNLFQNIIINEKEIRGEMDFILVNKKGVFIIESKHHRGIIQGNSSEQYLLYTKKSRQGGKKYTKKIYNPSKQVGTHVYKLSKYFKKNGINTWLEGIVYFSNPNVSLSISGNNSDKFFDSHQKIKRFLVNYTPRERILSNEQMNKICNLLRKIER